MWAFKKSVSLYLMSSAYLPNIAGLVCFLLPFLLSPALIWDNGPSLHSCWLTLFHPGMKQTFQPGSTQQIIEKLQGQVWDLLLLTQKEEFWDVFDFYPWLCLQLPVCPETSALLTVELFNRVELYFHSLCVVRWKKINYFTPVMPSKL